MTNYNKVRKETRQTSENSFENKQVIDEIAMEVTEDHVDPKLDGNLFGVTKTYLNMRSDKSIESVIIEVLPIKLKVEILDNTDSEWYEITYKNKTGYVLKQFVEVSD